MRTEEKAEDEMTQGKERMEKEEREKRERREERGGSLTP